MEDESDEFIKELIKNHVSGQLKVAPEHCSAAVLDKMGKPHIEAYKKFQQKFYAITKGMGKEQYLVPYLMSSHPGSTLKEAIDLAVFLKEHNMRPEQVQDFYPTREHFLHVCFIRDMIRIQWRRSMFRKLRKRKKMQRTLLQYFKPENKKNRYFSIEKAGRHDLIGYGKNCLVTPENGRK